MVHYLPPSPRELPAQEKASADRTATWAAPGGSKAAAVAMGRHAGHAACTGLGVYLRHWGPYLGLKSTHGLVCRLLTVV